MNDDNEQTDLLAKESLSLFLKFILVYMKVKYKTEISDKSVDQYLMEFCSLSINIFHEDVSSDDRAKQLIKKFKKEATDNYLYDTVIVAISYIMECMVVFAEKDQANHSSAWHNLSEAKFWLGVLLSRLNMTLDDLQKDEIKQEAIKQLTQNAVDARHKFNRKRAQEITDWYCDNYHKYRTQEDRAIEIMQRFSLSLSAANKHVARCSKELNESHQK